MSPGHAQPAGSRDRPGRFVAVMLVLIVLWPGLVGADTVILRSGRKIHNVKTRLSDRYLRVVKPGSRKARLIPLRQVRSILKRPVRPVARRRRVRRVRSRSTPRKRKPTIKPGPVRPPEAQKKPAETRSPVAYRRALPGPLQLDPSTPPRQRPTPREPNPVGPDSWWSWLPALPGMPDWQLPALAWPGPLSRRTRGYVPGLSGLTSEPGGLKFLGWGFIALEAYLAVFTTLLAGEGDAYPGSDSGAQLEQAVLLAAILRANEDQTTAAYGVLRLASLSDRLQDPRTGAWVTQARHRQLFRQHGLLLLGVCLLDGFLSGRFDSSKAASKTGAARGPVLLPGDSPRFQGFDLQAGKTMPGSTGGRVSLHFIF